MKNVLLFVAFFMLIVISSASKFTDCGSTTGQVGSVTVSNCTDSQDKCPLVRGTDATITIHFDSKADSKTLTAVVHGIIAGVPIPFHLPSTDACKTGVTCPVKKDESYTYTNVLNIKHSYPPLSVEVKWELKDESGADMVCVKIPCVIV